MAAAKKDSKPKATTGKKSTPQKNEEDEKAALNVASYSFEFNDEDSEVLGKNAKEGVEGYQESNFGAGIPISFLDLGEYSIRIYPDRDPRTGQARLMRKIWSAKLPSGGWVATNKDYDSLVDHYKNQGLKKIPWNIRGKILGIVMAHIYSCPKSKYVEPGRDVALVLSHPKFIYAMENFIAQMDTHERIEVFDPSREALPLKLTVTGGNNIDMSVGFASSKPVPLPPMILPKDVKWEGLDPIFIRPDQFPNSEQMNGLRKYLANELAKTEGSFKDTAGSGGGGHRAQERNNDDDQGTSEDSECPLQDATKKDPELAKEFPDVAFGAYPGEETPQCLMCANQVECIKRTEAD